MTQSDVVSGAIPDATSNEISDEISDEIPNEVSDAAAPAVIQITLAYSSKARHTREWHLTVPFGTTVEQAILQSGALREFTDLRWDQLALGIWGKACSARQWVKHNDRIEIYRPLRVDPKVARRERFAQQGAKSAGLFASKRAGAKTGYGG